MTVGPVLHMPEPVRESQAAPALEKELRAPEWRRAQAACNQVGHDLLGRAGLATGGPRAVLEATAAMATDSTLLDRIRTAVVEEGLPAPQAVWAAADGIASELAALGGGIGERARDLRDVRNRVVCGLLGRPVPGVPAHQVPFVLVARDLAGLSWLAGS